VAIRSDLDIQATDQSERAIRGGAIRLVGYALGVLISLGTATILVRHLGVPAFGRYVTVTSLVALVGAVTEAGIYVYGIREFVVLGETARRELIANLLAIRLVLAAVGVVGALCFAAAAGYRDILLFGTLIAGAALFVQVTSDVLSISLQAQLRLGRLTAVDLCRRALALGLIAALAVLGAGMLPLLAASALAAAAAMALMAYAVRSSVRLTLNFDWTRWRQLLPETLPYAAAASIGAIYFYVTVLLMSLIASAAQTGLFATSFRVTQVALGVPVLLLTAIFPLMSRERHHESRDAAEALDRVFTVAVIGGVWMSLATALAAPFIIDVVAGAAGKGAVSVLQIQALVLTFSFVSTSSALALVARRRYRTILLTSAGALTVNLVLGLALIPALGARGGALADVLTEALLAITLTALLMHAVQHHALRARTLIPVVISAALSATVLLMPIESLARAIGASAIYFGALFVMGAMPAELTTAARRVRALRVARW
jgi:O-antigen/teichoic acid export membrane protein